MAPSNNALWLSAKQDPVMTVGSAPYPTAGPQEVVIRTAAVAMNPADWLLQQTGMLLSEYPAILGCDAAGEVVEVGQGLEDQFKVGDRVFGAAGPLNGYRCSAFQEYVVLKAPSIAKIPAAAKYSEAAVLPLGFNTAASCLFAKETLGLEAPPSKAGHGKTVLIWGASSSLGCCGVQTATLAGYEVVAIASKANHDLVQSLGAKSSFDYNDSDIVQSVIRGLKGKEVVGMFDCISKPETLGALCEILSKTTNARKLIAAIQPGSEAHAKHDVEVKTNFVVDQAAYHGTVGKYLWQDFLPAALADGTFRHKPDPEIIGHGLENVQKAVDLLSKGVSAKKLVVTL
ncbi:hypothetical protein M409DRAFT_54734 [Zasmidium cellare ATCC 36951]|uniref:Enoyl reductase (ER) domain-containing protein n=1 Tax=Zasmidium cellare ATCC 36951 TaxID=1080233 RepID=A0A6A6CND9_ZASCE|nr:uncharacterized protein M409DRAFT_54734 [Zasmidium cellare ATCC 36951]KAF2166976.1 hypothetical protein M409DRAFT_54734 [Zasmidium cellare ATCC 36951]